MFLTEQEVSILYDWKFKDRDNNIIEIKKGEELTFYRVTEHDGEVYLRFLEYPKYLFPFDERLYASAKLTELEIIQWKK